MSSSTDRARDRDRDAAVGVVNAAFAAGRIVEADRDKRVQEISRAYSLQDITVQLGELAAPSSASVPVPAPAASSAPAPPPPPPPPPPGLYGPSAGGAAPVPAARVAGSRAVRRVRRAIVVFALASFAVPIAGAAIALVASARDYDFQGSTGTAPSDRSTYLPGQAPGASGVNVLTTDGFQALVAAVAAKTGSTTAYLAAAYPTYAVVEAQDPSGGGHYATYYWDGHALSGQGSLGSSTDQPIDLAAVDAQVMIDQLTVVRGRVTDPDSWYCVAQAPQGATPQISCYASNKYSDSSYTVVGLDGTLIYDSAAPS